MRAIFQLTMVPTVMSGEPVFLVEGAQLRYGSKTAWDCV